MKNLFILLSVVFFASCSTMYKSGQTPDDLYYAKPKTVVLFENNNRYERFDNTYEDRQIRMSSYDYRWRTLDAQYDYDYRYNPYTYGYNYGYYYNPYYYAYPVYGQSINFVNPKNTTIRTSNLGSYNNIITTSTPSKSSNNSGRRSEMRGYNNSNYQPARNNNNYNDTRSYSPSQSNNNNSNRNNNSNSNSSTPSSTGSSVPRPPRGQ